MSIPEVIAPAKCVDPAATLFSQVLPGAHFIEEAIRALEPDLDEADLDKLEKKAQVHKGLHKDPCCAFL